MDSFEWNKVFAALLVAGITASATGFIAGRLVPTPEAHEAGAEAGGEDEAAGVAAAPAMPEPILALIAGADAEHGKKLSKACATCHNFEQGGPNGVGPNLWNVLNAGKAHADGFAYSAGLAAKHGEKWAYEDLNHFLWKPRSLIADTKMTFAGFKKPEDRAAIIAFLRSMSSSAPALPSAGEIEKERADLAPPLPATPVVAPGTETAPASSENPASGSAPGADAPAPAPHQ